MTSSPVDLPSPTAASIPTRRFLGLDFAMLDEGAVLREIRERADRARFTYVVTPNTDHVVKLDKLAASEAGLDLRKAYGAADLCLCDSRILSKLARLSGIALKVIPGSDLTRMLFERSVIAAGDRVAVIGGTPDQLDWLRRRWPEIPFCQHIPPMGVLRDPRAQDEIIAFVETAKCNFVLFTIGAPQSELLAWRLAQRSKASGIGLCVGASIEFLSGSKRRAPRWVQKLALEWAFRLASEPRRLWRRYVVEGPRILPIWWRSRRSDAAVAPGSPPLERPARQEPEIHRHLPQHVERRDQ